jgi:zinc protease
VAGDVETGPLLEQVSRYFDEVPAGASIPPIFGDPKPVTLDGPMAVASRLVLEDRVELPRLYLAWRTPGLFAEGDAGLDMLAEVLTGGKTSRLYRTLVHERRIATDVSAVQGSRELGGLFSVIATAAHGHELDELERVITDEIASLADIGPDFREIERCLAQVEAQFVYRLQTVGGFDGRSDQLNAYNVFTGDPGFMARDRARYTEATADDLRALAATCLTSAGRVALSVVPNGSTGRALDGSTVARVS